MIDEFFTIGEVSKSTNISISTLRYYDQVGLLSPAYKNKDTNYRYYVPTQILMLRIIGYMRYMGFSIDYIKSHFENMEYGHTLKLFEKVIEETRLEIERLKDIEKNLIESCERLEEGFELERKIGIPFIEKLDDIKGVIHMESSKSKKELNKIIREREKLSYEEDIKAKTKGFCVSIESWRKNKEQKDYFLAELQNEKQNIETILPKGKYASMYIKGNFEEEDKIENLLEWINKKKLSPKGDLYIMFKDMFMFKDKQDFFYLVRVPV